MFCAVLHLLSGLSLRSINYLYLRNTYRGPWLTAAYKSEDKKPLLTVRVCTLVPTTMYTPVETCCIAILVYYYEYCCY